MADKLHVSVKCEAKELFDDELKPDLVKRMTETISDAINKQSGGKLVAKKSTEGFQLNASLSLKADDDDKPTKLDGKVAISVVATGSTIGAFKQTANGSLKGVGSKVGPAAEDLVVSILENAMPKTIDAILKL